MGGQFMIKISEEKWAKLPQIDDRLTELYGPDDSPSRKEFQAKAEAWYYAELLRDERKRQKLTQQQLGEQDLVLSLNRNFDGEGCSLSQC